MLGEYAHQPWIMAPFGASCILLHAVPQSPLAQPRNVIFGHAVFVAIGLSVALYAPINAFSIAIAVGLAICCMQFFRCVHPPAGANPLVSLVTVAYVMNNGRSVKPWPEYGLALWRTKEK
jgi:CBS-domain-containing membrane protein